MFLAVPIEPSAVPMAAPMHPVAIEDPSVFRTILSTLMARDQGEAQPTNGAGESVEANVTDASAGHVAPEKAPPQTRQAAPEPAIEPIQAELEGTDLMPVSSTATDPEAIEPNTPLQSAPPEGAAPSHDDHAAKASLAPSSDPERDSDSDSDRAEPPRTAQSRAQSTTGAEVALAATPEQHDTPTQPVKSSEGSASHGLAGPHGADMPAPLAPVAPASVASTSAKAALVIGRLSLTQGNAAVAAPSFEPTRTDADLPSASKSAQPDVPPVQPVARSVGAVTASPAERETTLQTAIIGPKSAGPPLTDGDPVWATPRSSATQRFSATPPPSLTGSAAFSGAPMVSPDTSAPLTTNADTDHTPHVQPSHARAEGIATAPPAIVPATAFAPPAETVYRPTVSRGPLAPAASVVALVETTAPAQSFAPSPISVVVPAMAPDSPVIQAAAPGQSDVAQSVARQIAAHIPAAGGTGFELSLAPEELGAVRLKLVGSDAGSLLIVQTDRPETLDLLRRHIGLLEQDLRALGHDTLSIRFSGTGTGGGQSQAGTQHGNQQDTPGQPEADTSHALAQPAGRPIAAQPTANDHLDLRL